MPLTTVTVTIQADLITGEPLPGGRVRFALTALDVAPGQGLVVPKPQVVTLDDNGAGSIELWPNAAGEQGTQYRVVITDSAGALQYTGLATVPQVDCNLHEIVGLAAPASTDSRDRANGYAGLTGFLINLKNAAGTITSYLASVATVARTWTFPDKSGTVAMTSDLTKANVGLGNADNTSDVDKPVSTAQQAALDLKAPLASPALTGTPTGPTAALGTNTTQLATMAALQAAIANLVNSAPGALDTLKELADALGDDPNFAATVASAIAGKTDKTTSLKDWALTQSFGLTSATRNSDDVVTTASILWPDGVTGTFVADIVSTEFPGAVDAWHASYEGTPPRTITQPVVTRNAAGAVTAQPDITIV